MTYPNASLELREQLALDCFIDALNDRELEWSVYQGKPKTLDQAVQLALEYEAFQKGKQKYSTGPRGLRMQHEVTDTENTAPGCNETQNSPSLNDIVGRLAKVEGKVNESSIQSDKPNQNRKNWHSYRKRPGNCRYCGRPGHWRAECRKRQFDEQERANANVKNANYQDQPNANQGNAK